MVRGKLDIIINVLFIAVIIGAGIFLWKNSRLVALRDGEVIVTQAYLDSLDAVANLPPDTIYQDTIIYKDTTIIINKELPKPKKKKIKPKDDIAIYEDSLVTNDVNVYLTDHIQGELLYRQWSYKPVIREKRVIIEKKLPVPVVREKLISQSGWYGGVQGGFINQNSVLLYADLITEKQYQFGISAGFIGNDGIMLFRIGKKFN